MKEKYRVVLLQPIHKVGVEKLREKFEVIVYDYPQDIDEDTVTRAVRDADAVITRLVRVTRKVIYSSGKLKVIGRHGVGYDNIDVDAATERRIPVVYTPDAPSEPVAEHVIGFILALSKNIVKGDKALRKATWIGWKARFMYVGRNVKGRVLGIIGLGRIGSLVAKYAKALGMNVIYYDAVRKTDLERILDIEYRNLEELLKESDFVSLHVPLTKATEGMIGWNELNLMKQSAYLINTSRGKVVDEGALIKALKEGIIAGAALDVFWNEPLPKDHPLVDMDNVILSPHMSAHTEEFFLEAALTVAEDIIRVLEGKKPLHIVNPEIYS